MSTKFTTSRIKDMCMRRSLGTVHIDPVFDEDGFNYRLTQEGTKRDNLFRTLAEAKDFAIYLNR